MKLILKILGLLFLVFILFGAGGIFYITRGLKAGETLEIGEVNFGNLPNGTYTGIFKDGRWSNEVEVYIDNRRIVEIRIVKDVVFSKPEEREDLFSRVIQNQSLQVDVVAGATVTSKAYLKALEDAVN